MSIASHLKGIPNKASSVASKKPETAQVSIASGLPLSLDINLVDEDPDQPRTAENEGFSDESLAELAAAIQLRGVKTPISVRENAKSPGRYVINHGARRLRASKIAGKATIPGFIDNDYNHADQVVENLQRNGLSAREIANFIDREIKAGRSQTDIAKSLSKSSAFISQHKALLDLPEPIAKIFNDGRLTDVTVVSEILRAYKDSADEVSVWLSQPDQEFTRGAVRVLREYLDDKSKRELTPTTPVTATATGTDTGNSLTGFDDNAFRTTGAPIDVKDARNSSPAPTIKDAGEQKAADPSKLKKAIVQVEFKGRPARLVLNRRPPTIGYAWLKYDDDGEEFEANLGKVKLVAIVEG